MVSRQRAECCGQRRHCSGNEPNLTKVVSWCPDNEQHRVKTVFQKGAKKLQDGFVASSQRESKSWPYSGREQVRTQNQGDVRARRQGAPRICCGKEPAAIKSTRCPAEWQHVVNTVFLQGANDNQDRLRCVKPKRIKATSAPAK